MLQISRRGFLGSLSALLLTGWRGKPGLASTPTRLARKDCFFGLHFDLHPDATDTVLGRDVTDAMVDGLLQACSPDFVQYDSKGHPGYLGFPSKTGMTAGGIVHDSLAIWRRATARRGVALYNHFSGVLDGQAVARHPEWARVGPEGAADTAETSLFSPYEQQLMIPELREAALNYDLDGSWVDGDCWAVKLDYGPAAQEKFHRLTSIEILPRKAGDPGWNQFVEMQRTQFREYVAQYVAALHQAKPGFQITSNWMYSTFMPERPLLPLDYLSGDITDVAPMRRARLEARYFASCGKTWDLMSWGFDTGGDFADPSDKPAAALQQEAAVVLAQGGAFQIYYTPTRAGWIDAGVMQTAAEVGRFCRERQQASHHSESVCEAGVIFSGRSLYQSGKRPFGPWGAHAHPAEGAVDLLLACGYSVDIVPDWAAAESVHRYPLMVLPDWQDVGGELMKVLAEYLNQGGKLLLGGAENVKLFAGVLGLRAEAPIENGSYFISDHTGFAECKGTWALIVAAEAQVFMSAYRNKDTRNDAVPFGVLVGYGKGQVVACPGPLFASYAATRASTLMSAGKRLATALYQPAVRLQRDDPTIEVVMRKKDGKTFLHLINAAGATVSSEFRNSGVVPRTGPLPLRIRLPAAPLQVVLRPQATTLIGRYEGGDWVGTLPDLHIHCILEITAQG